MYRCDECGLLFEEPRIVREEHGEEYGICPNCGGAYETVYLCKACGEEYTEDEYCPECLEIVEDMFGQLIERVKAACNSDRDKALEVISDVLERIA